MNEGQCKATTSEVTDSSEHLPPTAATSAGVAAFNSKNAQDLIDSYGPPSQVRISRPTPDGGTEVLIYGRQSVDVHEPWGTWLRHVVRSATSTILSRLFWLALGALLGAEAAGRKVVQPILAVLF